MDTPIFIVCLKNSVYIHLELRIVFEVFKLYKNCIIVTRVPDIYENLSGIIGNALLEVAKIFSESGVNLRRIGGERHFKNQGKKGREAKSRCFCL